MEREPSRRSLLAAGATLALALAGRVPAARGADDLPEVTVYKSPT